MNNNIQISTRVRRLFHYLEDFEKGNIQVPPFQRKYVWKNPQKLELLDSIKAGYPIGSILLWRPNDKLVNDLYKIKSQTIGSYKLPEKHSNFFYILDGYQRLSTLFGCLVNPSKTQLTRNETEWKKQFDIVYNLEEDVFTMNKKKSNLKIYEIPIFKFIDGEEFYEFQSELIKHEIDKQKVDVYLQRYKNFGAKISTYDIPSIDLTGGSISEAVDIFSRLNTRGQTLSDDWKISALSYDNDKGFILAVEIDDLLHNLEPFNFFSKKNAQGKERKIVLQCITNSFGNVYFDTLTKNNQNTLEKLATRHDFISTTRQTFTAIEKSVTFLFKKLGLVDSRLLPYNSQFIFITDFFNKIENPSENQLKTLKDWFWITTYSNYFTRYNLSKQRRAYDKFQAFIEDENESPVYYDKGHTFETLEFPDKIDMGSVRAKAFALFMINHQIENTNLDTEMLNGYKTYKLFKDKGNISENTILVIDDGSIQIPKSKKDLSFWLDSPENHKRFFITSGMKNDYKNSVSPEAILYRRKKFILENEKGFIEDFGLKYIE